MRLDRPVLIWGVSGQASVVGRMLADAGREVVVTVDRDPSRPPISPDIPLLVPDQVGAWVASFPSTLDYVVAIGGTLGRDRLEIADVLDDLGLQPLTVVHDRAWVDQTTELGTGTQVCAMAAVGVEVRVGRQCIVNTNASVDHSCSVGDGVHVMPGATVAGDVTIEDGATIGSNATVLPHLTIGADAVVGAGAVVTRSVPSGATVTGAPARSR